MKSTVASLLAVTFYAIGFAIGAGIWAVIGWCLGSLFSHAPVTGALCGLAYQLWACIQMRDELWAAVERNQERFQLILERL